VLINLQHLNVVVCEPQADGGQDEQCADPGLRRGRTAEGFASDHDSSNVCDQRKKDNDVAIDAVDESELVSNGWGELKDHEETSSYSLLAKNRAQRVSPRDCLRNMVKRWSLIPILYRSKFW
jgi:hypothetical protein